MKCLKPLPSAKITIEVKGYTETKWTSRGGVWTNDPEDARESIVPIGKKLFTVSEVVRESKEGVLEPNAVSDSNFTSLVTSIVRYKVAKF
jgi:hypothetical protein